MEALARVARYKPKFTAVIVFLGGSVAFLEGVGLSFIWPILRVARSEEQITEAEGILGMFVDAYQIVGIPFTLEFLIIGICAVMTLRYTTSFLVAWLKAILGMSYEKYLRNQTFEAALDAEIGYFDDEGSDDILNAIITETGYSSTVISGGIVAMETLFLILVYLSVMLYIAPLLAVAALGLLGGITYVLRYVLEPAFTVGDRVAEANQG